MTWKTLVLPRLPPHEVEVIRALLTELAAKVKRPRPTALVHGDLDGQHILWDAENRQVNIIRARSRKATRSSRSASSCTGRSPGLLAARAPVGHPALEALVVHELLEQLGVVLDHAGDSAGQDLVVLDAGVGIVGVLPGVPEGRVRGHLGGMVSVMSSPTRDLGLDTAGHDFGPAVRSCMDFQRFGTRSKLDQPREPCTNSDGS